MNKKNKKIKKWLVPNKTAKFGGQERKKEKPMRKKKQNLQQQKKKVESSV